MNDEDYVESMTKRRVLLIEVDAPSPRWSASELEQGLSLMAPILNAKVYGEIDLSIARATFQKMQKWSRETEEGASQNDRMHSAYKALAWFRELWPTKLWNERLGMTQPGGES